MSSYNYHKLHDILRTKFVESRIFRNRIFFCCVAGHEVVVAVDNRSFLDREDLNTYSDMLIPTICGSCRRQKVDRATGHTLDIDELVAQHEPKEIIDMEISQAMCEDWSVFKAVEEYCQVKPVEGDYHEHVTVVPRVFDHRTITKEIKKYRVRLHSAELQFYNGGKKQRLENLPYFDPGFL